MKGIILAGGEGQDKEGEIFDVAVDIRKSSPIFGKWFGTKLSGANVKQMYIPPGFAHGFCVLSDYADVFYKCTDLYSPGMNTLYYGPI